MGNQPTGGNIAICTAAALMRRALGLTLVLIAGGLLFGAVPTYAFHYVSLFQFGSLGSQAGELTSPQGVAIDQSSGDVYIADAGNYRVDEFDSAGNFIAAWGWGVADGIAHGEVCMAVCAAGLPGSGQGQFARPVAIAVDNSAGQSKGDVYVADEANAVVYKFDPNGALLAMLTAGTGGHFQALYGVAVDSSGNVWAYDAGAEVYEFSANGSEIRQWNTHYVTSPGFAVGVKQDVYAVRHCGCTEKFSSIGQDLGEVDTSNDKATSLAVDHFTDSLFDDQGTFIARYDGNAILPTTPLTSFGQGELHASTGLDVHWSDARVFASDATGDDVHVFGPPSPGPPEIESATVRDVGSTSAQLNAAIYTGQTDTLYRFEYGTSTAYGSVAPASDTDIGSGLQTVQVNATLTGLAPETVYHYRVVTENIHGVATSTDRTFVTFPLESAGLPDERAYELVSPSDKNGGDIGSFFEPGVQAAPSGELVTYVSTSSFGSSQSNDLLNQYLARRTAGGWSTQGISPPSASGENLTFESPYLSFSSDLSSAVLTWVDPPLTTEASVGYRNIYVRNNFDGSYQLVTIGVASKGSESRFVGASADDSHVVFQTGDALTSNAAPGAQNIYEWTQGEGLALVSIPPQSAVGSPNAGAGDGGGDMQNAVSLDGSLVFWTDAAGQLYLWRLGAGSTKVNASQRIPSAGNGLAGFLGAAADGSNVLFSDETPLTESVDDNGGLYEFETNTGRLLDLTPDGEGNPGVQGLLGDSSDASWVYFVATGKLAEGASAGQMNLYVSHAGTVSFIATLSGQDSGDWAHEPTSRHAAVSPDGTYAVFTSNASLTGYDNVDAITGVHDSEVFEYDAQTAQLRCVSCNPSREPPIGASSVPNWLKGDYNPRYLSNDGSRVFFDSADELTPVDVNGTNDVYEWEHGGHCPWPQGCVYLISSGTSDTDSLFADASPSGNDVFFTTRSQLASGDVDENVDLYDARVGGGFPPSPAVAQCVGEACLGPLTAPPAFAGPAAGQAEPPAPPNASFTLARPHARAVRLFARSGKLRLHVRVSRPGKLTARATIEWHGRRLLVAFALKSLSKPAGATLLLTLSGRARRLLLARDALRLTIAVTFSSGPEIKRLSLTLHRAGGHR